MFSESKVAQMAAYLLDRRGGTMSHLKLMKLLYLADREAMDRCGAPISGDRLVNMPQGPVLSKTLDYMNGALESGAGGWEHWISDKENHEVSLNQKVVREKLDKLSDADIQVLESIWKKFGSMDRWKIRDYTHRLPEWKDPDKSSTMLGYKDIFAALGFPEKEACDLSDSLDAEQSIDSLFARL